ncbi:MAG TPA: SUMF1/EgtB/PvdO family nonheme iron enzyme, partial [Anaerolineales bacterium]|nr:SUMF1/EgtB/PvdO family nonheme iron enzyme [Anaerolineales bacterium]
MDIPKLAQDAAQILAPLLPFLLQGAKDAARAAFERAGEKSFDLAWKQGETLWEKLKGRVDTEQDAVKRALQKPEEKRVIQHLQSSLEFQLEDVFNADAELTKSVNTVMAGDSSLAIGHDMKDSNATIGDGNFTASHGGQIHQTIQHQHFYGEPKKERVARKNKKVETEPLSDEETRIQYLNSIINDCKRARLVGLDPQAADVTRGAFSLDHLYISLDTKTQVEIKKDEEADEKREFRFDKTRPLSVLEALSGKDEQSMVLLGLPGAGKSTFVRYLALWHAQALLDSKINFSEKLPKWNGTPMLPVIIPLGRLAESLPKESKRGTAEFIEKYFEQAMSFPTTLFKHTLEQGGLFLFDGLDEVADLGSRPIVVEAVEQFAAKYGKNRNSRFLVTCRTFSYTDPRWQLTSWAAHELAPLTRKKINQFIEYWHNECIAVDPARKDDYEDKRKKLHEALQEGDHRRLWEIADNPLILTVMAVVHTHKGDLPDARALVYEECIDLLLLRWEAERTVTGKSQRKDLRSALNVPDIALRNVLQEIAYHAHERERKTDGKREGQAALVTEDLLRADLHAAFQNDEKVQIFMDYCESANGLLMLQGVAPLPDAPPDAPPRRVYAFPHLTFEEYLAARYLRRMKTLGQKTFEHLTRSDRWREVVMLLGEHICFRDGDYELMDTILNALAPQPTQPQTAEDWKARWAAGDLLLLYQRAFEQRKDQHTHIAHNLAALVQGSHLTSRERAEAADTLARLGDPRFDVDHWHLPKESLLGFVHIPAGEFLMGTREADIKGLIEKFGGDEGDYKSETPQHKLNLPDYFMARYPVTTAQFKAFVEESGHKPDMEASLRGLPTRPAVYVTWYDAIAYCKWLSEKLKAVAPSRKGSNETEETFWRGLESGKFTVTLPSEAEWEKAARGGLPSPDRRGAGGEVRNFPWGVDVNLDKVNGNMVIGRTSAVGAFPLGKSPYDLQDMSGNVWEWTRSLWGKDYNLEYTYPYNKEDGRENLEAEKNVARVLRGGAYLYGGRYLRCAFRNRVDPDLRV